MYWRERERQIETDSYPWKSSARQRKKKQGERIESKRKDSVFSGLRRFN